MSKKMTCLFASAAGIPTGGSLESVKCSSPKSERSATSNGSWEKLPLTDKGMEKYINKQGGSDNLFSGFYLGFANLDELDPTFKL